MRITNDEQDLGLLGKVLNQLHHLTRFRLRNIKLINDPEGMLTDFQTQR